MEHLAEITAVVVAAIVAFFTSKRTTNGITGNITHHLSSKEDTGTTLREAVEEVRDTCAVVLANVQTVDRRLFRTEERLEAHLDAQDVRLNEQGERIEGISSRVTILEKWREKA